MKKKYENIHKGVSIVEVVVGVAIITVFLVGVTEVGRYSSRLLYSAQYQLESTFLLEEGLDAVRGLRDGGFAANIAPLSLNSDYWLVFNGSQWQLSSSPQKFIDGRFDRRIQIYSVGRDSNDDIVASGGTTDPNTKKVTVSVSWFDRGATTTEAASTYFTNLFNN